MIDKIKNIIQKEEQKKQPYPPQFLAIRWRTNAAQSGLKGNRAKEIVHVVHQNEKERWPFQPEIAQSLKEEMNLPILDETGGQDRPKPTTLEQYDPGRIQW